MALLGKSESRLARAHPDLAQLFRSVAQHWDVLVMESDRSPERQKMLYDTGKSKTLDSKHLIQQDGFAWAVDVAADPVDWRDTGRFYYFAGYVKAIADKLGFKFRWGGDWDSDHIMNDQTFNDLVHFEKVQG